MKIFSDISLWWMWLWAIISVAISIWYYRKQKQVEGASLLKKSTLIGLRSLALILLGVLLFGILLETSESKS
jgi:ABC-type proline/glycine betaine transport system permease subunit